MVNVDVFDVSFDSTTVKSPLEGMDDDWGDEVDAFTVTETF